MFFWNTLDKYQQISLLIKALVIYLILIAIILAIVALIGVSFNSVTNIIKKHKLKKQMEKLMNRVEVILYEEGFRPQKMENQIQFKLEGNTFLINFDKKDPSYFSISDYVYTCKDDEISDLLISFNKLNQNVKHATITVDENNIVISADAFIDENSSIKEFLFRLLESLLFMKSEFSEHLNYKEISLN